MKILAIASSPRRNGNSETLLLKALSSINKKGVVVKKVIISNLDISPCTGCQACSKLGECVIKDDMRILYEDLLEADILLAASPVYFKGLPCKLKCVIDRCQALWARKYVLKKQLVSKKKKAGRKGAVMLACASAGVKDMFLASTIVLKAWLNTLDFRYKKEFLAEGLEEEAAALKDKKLLKRAGEFGKKLI